MLADQLLGAVEEHGPAAILHPHTDRLVGLQCSGLGDIKGSPFAAGDGCHIEADPGRRAEARSPFDVLLVHAGITVARLRVRVGQFGSLLPHFHVPDGGHVAVLLGIGDGDAYEPGLSLALVDHRGALHGVVGTVGVKGPLLAVERCLNAILVEEGGVFELGPYFVEGDRLAEVDLEPLFAVTACAPVGVAGFPQRGIVVVNGILRAEVVVVIGRGRDLGAKCEVYGLRLEERYALRVVCRNDGQDIPIGIKLHLVDTYLSVEAMHAAGQVVAVIDDIVFAILFENGVVARSVDGLVGIGLEDAALILKRSHGARCRSGILHAVGVVVAGAR